MIDFASLPTPPVPTMSPAGQVFVIRCEPDPFTGERVNVGVCVIDEAGRRYVKTIGEAGRLECLYGETGGATVVSMAQIAGGCAQAGLPSPSSQIEFSQPVPFYNSSPKAMLDATFADQVTVAIPRRSDLGKQSIDDEAALLAVTDIIKHRRELEVEFLANTPQIIINTNRGPRPVTIPLQPIDGAGVIRSAYYSPSTLKSHLMDSVLDLDCVARYREKKHLGLFILRPKKPTAREEKATTSVIESVAFRAPPGLKMEIADTAEELAEQVTEWALSCG